MKHNPTHPAHIGIIDLDNFTPEEKTKLRAIHRRVLQEKLRKEISAKVDHTEKIIQENILLKRLLLAARNHIVISSTTQELIKQIDERLRLGA